MEEIVNMMGSMSSDIPDCQTCQIIKIDNFPGSITVLSVPITNNPAIINLIKVREEGLKCKLNNVGSPGDHNNRTVAFM